MLETVIRLPECTVKSHSFTPSTQLVNVLHATQAIPAHFMSTSGITGLSSYISICPHYRYKPWRGCSNVSCCALPWRAEECRWCWHALSLGPRYATSPHTIYSTIECTGPIDFETKAKCVDYDLHRSAPEARRNVPW